MRKNLKQKIIIDSIADAIHQMISVTTISMYNNVKKLVDPSVSDEEKENASVIINKMMITAENLYEDLTDTQKELYREIVQNIIDMIQK